MLNDVKRLCDCKYLNDYIEEKHIDCSQYAKLLFAAMSNNKAEIVFKNHLYSSVHHIEDICAYLEEFTSKQIDFAAKNGAINALPFIKQHGVYDVKTLYNIEKIMRKRENDHSVYNNIKRAFERLNFDIMICP